MKPPAARTVTALKTHAAVGMRETADSVSGAAPEEVDQTR
jgi:hypothetical protein